MKRIITYLIITLATAISAVAATPQQQLAAAAKKLAAAPSVTATFTMVTNGGRGGNARGTMQMAQKNCTVNAGGITLWYDGTTQWVYSVATQEVNISKPTLDDLLESNPFVLISNYASNFNVKSSGTNTAVLTPKNIQKSGIEKATVTFGANGWPAKIHIKFQNGSTIDVSVSKITIGKKLPASTFRFNPRLYPEAEIIDLR